MPAVQIAADLPQNLDDERKGISKLVQDLDEWWNGVEQKDKGDWFGPSYSPEKMPLANSHLEDAYSILGPVNKVLVSEMRPMLTELTSQLASYGHDELALDILNHVQHKAQHAIQNDENMQDIQAAKGLINNAIAIVLTRLLGKVMKQMPSDKQVCLHLALQLQEGDIISLINKETKVSAFGNHNRLKKILEIVTACGELHRNEDMVNQCLKLSRQEKWRNRLSKLGLSLGPSPSKKTILHAVTTLMLHNNTTFPLVQEFVLDMDLNPEVVQQEYKSSFCSILTQAPVSPGALDKAKSILHVISDVSSRLAVIQHALPMISEYNYEVLEFLMDQRDLLENNKSNKKSIELLKLLKEYKRKFPPCSIEEEAVSTSCFQSPDILSSSLSNAITTTSSAAATTAKMITWERQQQSIRLPFRLLQERMGKIMEAELTTSTLPAWQLIASVLGSPKDRIIVSLATKLVTSYTKPHFNGLSDARDGGNFNDNGIGKILNSTASVSANVTLPVEDNGMVTEEFESLLQELGPILLQLERKECGIWFCQATTDKLSRIGDKVRTLENGLSFAKMWTEECSATDNSDKNKAEKAMKVFESKILPLSTQWALIRSGLGLREELMPLINQPEQLIRHLYHLPLKTVSDKFCIKPNRFGTEKEGEERRARLDELLVQSVCEEIAELHDLDLLSTQTSLIDLWLTGIDSTSALNDAEQTMFNVTVDFNLSCDFVNEEESIARIVSMLKSSNGPAHAEHLLEILFGDEFDGDATVQQRQQINLSLKAQRMVILCLWETGFASPELRFDLKLLNQLISIQSFGINFTWKMYRQMDKLPLVLRLWEKYKGQRMTGPLVGSLCLDQSMASLPIPSQLWNSVLLQMAKFEQKTSLRPLMISLIQARGLERVKQMDGFIRAKMMI